MEENEKVALSVVVPIYNEEGNVQLLHEKIRSVCQEIGKPYEIIFIDDGSTDGTEELCKKLSPLTYIRFRKNFGQTAAFDAGFKVATGRVIVTMDGDLQNDPADIPLLLDKMEVSHVDIVSGWRWQRKDSLEKKIFSRTANLLRKVFVKDDIHDSGCSLKAFKRECFAELDLFGEMHRFIPALLQLQGYTVGEVKVSHHPRIHGVTKYNWKRSVKGLVDMVAIWFWRKSAHRPLHLFGAAGFVLSIFGFAVLAWMFVEKVFMGYSISERIWPLVGIFAILAGVQFFISGLLADILIKNYYKNHNHMNYSIREVRKQN